MKDQYFGDVNDYRKYGLLRALSSTGLSSMALAWLRTEVEGNSDGGSRTYVKKPAQYRSFDPELFDFLAREDGQARGARSVSRISDSGLLSHAISYDRILTDDASARETYFSVLWNAAAHSELIFFDPDKGIETDSAIPKIGNKESSSYIYWSELTEAWRRGHSLLVYQHYPHVERGSYCASRIELAAVRLPGAVFAAFGTENAVFLLALQRRHEATARALHAVAAQWTFTGHLRCSWWGHPKGLAGRRD
ncbi:hypothetical protein HZA57_02880 [Candidatus Poribacteria bacterium]|nr:hypothetical protein [Candidatus Poribacteria bacterium]